MAQPLHILHVFPTFAVGGSQRRFATLANNFGDRYVHTVMSLDGCIDAVPLIDQSVGLRIGASPSSGHRTPTGIWRARRSIERFEPDLMVTYNWGSMEWAAANRIPLLRHFRHIHIEDGFGTDEANRQLMRRVWFRRLVLGRNDRVVLPSMTLVRIALDVWRLDPKRVIYLPNGVACDLFMSPEGSERIRPLTIGTVATLRPEKRLDRLILAFERIRKTHDARLIIVGDGAERRKLVDLVTSRGLGADVTFAGATNRPETVYGGFDVFAMSSDTEQMPLSVLEAMAAGLPVVATNAGDTKALVAPENATLVVDKTEDALVEALLTALGNPELRHRLGLANRTRALAVFDQSRMLATYDRLFSGLPVAAVG